MYRDDYRSFREHLQSPYGKPCVISKQSNSKFHQILQIVGTLSAPKMGCYDARKDIWLVLDYHITFIIFRTMIIGASDSIYQSLTIYTVSFLPKTTPIFHEIYQISGTLSVWEKGCCSARRYIHCCLTNPWSSLGIQEWIYELLILYVIPLWSTSYPFCWKLISISYKISSFEPTLSTWNWMLLCK